MLGWYQHLPSMIDPVAFSVGSVAVRWYGMLFVFGFATAGYVFWRLVRESDMRASGDQAADAVLWVFLGAVLGGRAGFFVLYAWDAFVRDPLILFGFSSGAGAWQGWSGMSFFGGLIGAIVALAWYAKRQGWPFWKIADRAALATPIGIFFGRIGNFFNGELFGRLTSVSWGMYFPNDASGGTVLRHPSQLYEALGEGMLLFMFLWSIRRRCTRTGELSMLFVAGYAVIRFCLEFFREPDACALSFLALTRGQWLALAAFGLLGIFRYRVSYRAHGSDML